MKNERDLHDQRAGISTIRKSSNEKNTLHLRNPLTWISLVRWLYVFLFTYTGYGKLKNINSFVKGIQKVPYLGNYADFIGWSVPILELVLAVGLVLPLKRPATIAIKASAALMVVFTLYLLLMIILVKEKMCHCGGVIESLSWPQHLVFNTIVLILGIWAIRKENKIIKL